MKEFIKNHSVFIIVLLIASLTRFLFVEKTPPSLNWDEISHGYNAYSILKSGRDEWGRVLPTIFRAYGDYKLPVYIYLTSISEFFFGLNELSVRLVSILAGLGTIFLSYLISKRVFSNKNIAILTSLLVGFEPWTFFLGRPAFEANLAQFLFLVGVFFVVKVKESFDGTHLIEKYIYLSAIFFGLTVWTYNSYRIFTPLFLVSLCFVFRNELKNIFLGKRKLIGGTLIILGLFFIPMFYQLVTTSGSARYSKVGIIDEGAIARIEELRRDYPRLVVNKATYFAYEFGKNYISYFDPRFLFLMGGDQYQFSVQNYGLIYLINLPFFYLGIWYVFKNRKLKEIQVIILWLIISPIAGSITREAPHVLRSITMLPLPMLLTSFGFFEIMSKIKREKRVFVTLGYAFILFISIENYFQKYFVEYTTKYSQAWQYGYKEVASYINENSDDYAKIVITKKYGEPHEFMLFYTAYDPESYRNDKNLNRFFQSDWYWVDGFSKYYFVNDWDIPKEGYKFILESKKTVDCRQAKCLLVTSANNAPLGWSKIKTVNFLNGDVAFEFYENN